MESRVSAGELARLGVTVRIPTTLRAYTDGQDEVLLEGTDLAALLRRLDDAFPGIRERVVDETGAPRRYVNLFVNDELASTGIGYVSDIVYCTLTGPNTIKVRALDTSGNASAFSNELIFVC